jgi:hypothetical protein
MFVNHRTVVTPLGEKPSLAVPGKHTPRDAATKTLTIDPKHWKPQEAAADGREG